MNESMIILAATYLFTAVLVIAQPWLSRKNVLFSVVFSGESIWADEEAKKIRKRYLAESAVSFVLISAMAIFFFLLSKKTGLTLLYAFLFAVIANLLVETVLYILANRRTKTFKRAQFEDEALVYNKIVVETGLPEKTAVLSPALSLLLIPMLLATVLVAVLGYSHMPAEIPVHYNFTAADAWAKKSWSNVGIPLIGEVFVAVVFAISFLLSRRAPASVRGNPGAAPDAFRFRKYINIIVLLLGLVCELNFLILEIGNLTYVLPMAFLIPEGIMLILTVLIFIVYFFLVRAKKPSGPILDDDAKWVLGLYYYNPSDPALFVEKRVGIGYTVNFAKPAAWVFTIGILAAVVAILIFSFTTKS
jgi:uncharacterized membrane protein